jgi:tetratricopeptide (TPR) repeat protein
MSGAAPGTAPDAAAAPPVADEARRIYQKADSLSTHPDHARYVEALKAYVAFVDGHRKGLEDDASETAGRLDRVGAALHRASQTDLAARAFELGLSMAPGAPSLLHHKAMVLIAQNKSLEDALALLDQALSASPHDKQIWGTKGDALRLLDRPKEAAEAYVRAQQLDATSMQYVERALKVAPNHAVALRMKLQLARAHGGDRQALEACEALLQANPKDGPLLLARAELLTALGAVEPALEALSAAEAVLPEDPKLTLLKGRLLHASGKTAEASETFRQLLNSKTRLDPVALSEMADTLEQTDDAATAIDARIRLKEVEPRNLGNLSALRELARKAGRTDVALDACLAVLDASPGNLEAMRAIADLHAEAFQTDEAIDAFRALLAAHPHEIGEARRAVEFARSVGALPIVVEFSRIAIAEDPSDLAIQAGLAHALSVLGDKEGALESINALLKDRPSDSGLLTEKKQLLMDLERNDELPAVYDELFRIDPTRTDVALERGHLYLARAFDSPEGSAEREEAARTALVSYERASVDRDLATRSLLGLARASRLVRDPERAIRGYRDFLAVPGNAERGDVLKELGHALREVGRLTEAEAVYSQAIQLGLEDPDLFWSESEVLSLLNQEAKALRFVDLLLEREPANPLYLRRKGQLLLRSGRRPEALTILKRAVEASRGDPHVYFEVAEALRATGSYADAISYFREGLAIDPKHRPGRLALAQTLALAGQHNEAIPLLDTLLREDPNDIATWKARAEAYRRLQRPADVLYSLQAILLLDPHNGAALLEKYRMHRDRGEKTEAFDCLTMLLESGGPEASEAPLLLEHGDLSAELGRTEEANKSYEKAAQLDASQVPEIATRRARLRLSAGRPDLALEVLDAALQASPAGAPRNPRALILRAEILTALERPAEAGAVYEEVRQSEPNSPQALAGVGRALLDQGKHAEAKEFLAGAIPKAPPEPSLYLLLAEAEAGLGSVPAAIQTIQHGVDVLPASGPLWVRLGELQIAREAWPEAANALAHAISIDAANPTLHLRAGFVAERLGHPNEALALYDRATQVAPSDKNAWCSRGLALLAIGRPEEAQSSFERALALDGDFEPAKDGKKAAVQKTREGLIERHGREALLLEAKLHRAVTKNDLFVTLHVPFDLLEPVLTSLARTPRIDLARLSETEMRDLEGASYHLISTALERRPEGIERRGFTQADVAVLSPPTATLDQVQRLFGYLKSVLEADLRPENLKLEPDVEELARKALLLPENQRTLFQLVRTLHVGIFKARLIKVVESAGSAVHAPLASLDLGQYSPEFRAESDAVTQAGEVFFSPENVPATPAKAGGTAAHSSSHHSAPSAPKATATPTARCVGCGGIASIEHECGATLCQHCIAQFHTCPKCGRAISPTSTRALGAPASHAAHAAASSSSESEKGGHHPVRALLSRAKPPSAKPSHPAEKTHGGAPPAGKDGDDEEGAEEETPAPPRPPHPREKPDDEPRL